MFGILGCAIIVSFCGQGIFIVRLFWVVEGYFWYFYSIYSDMVFVGISELFPDPSWVL